jgi:hypothetical protein
MTTLYAWTACTRLVSDAVEECHYFLDQHNYRIIQFASNCVFAVEKADQPTTAPLASIEEVLVLGR